MPLVPDVKNVDVSVKRAIQGLSKKLGYTASPVFVGISLTGMTASRLLATDSAKAFESVADLTTWITQDSANRVVVTDDGDGTLTLSTPQDIHTDAAPEWAGTVIKDSGGYTIFYVNNDEMYFTAVPSAPVTGNPMPWLFWFTYTI